LLFVGVALHPSHPAQAQVASTASADVEDRLRSAQDALRRGEVGTAHDVLAPLWRQKKAAVHPQMGSVAYWMGRIFAAAQNPGRARATWQTGLALLELKGRFDPRLSDAYLRSVFKAEHEAAYLRATESFTTLLERAGRADVPVEREIINRHASQMAFLLTDAQRSSWLNKRGPRDDEYAIRDGYGTGLAAWWRRQDPVPRTERNEALEEHLHRVLHAETKYEDTGSLRGFDDRGMIYARLGEPGYTRDIEYDRFDIPFDAGFVDFPDHEVWAYPSFGQEAFYVFVEEGPRYRLRDFGALIPRELQLGMGSTGRRGPAKVRAVLNVMRQAAREMAFNEEYARLYYDIWDYQETRLSLPERGTPPHMFAMSRLADMRSVDQRQRLRREEIVPTQKMPESVTPVPLPVSFRHARFLDGDGRTRTLLFWSHPPGTFEDRSRVINVTAVQSDARYRRRDRAVKRYTPSSADVRGEIQVRALTVAGDTGRYNVQMQWGEYGEAARTSDGLRLSNNKRMSVTTLDSLEAISTDPSTLSMSDLLPGTLSDQGPADSLGLAGEMAITPYPLPIIRPDMRLTLYFELYDLAIGPGDQAEYTVSYEVERVDEGGLFQLFQERAERTTAETTYQSAGRRASEYIQLDLRRIEDADRVKVTVRVTDAVSGQQATRSLQFGMDR
jgi:GWxTD domain-containing protein